MLEGTPKDFNIENIFTQPFIPVEKEVVGDVNKAKLPEITEELKSPVNEPKAETKPVIEVKKEEPKKEVEAPVEDAEPSEGISALYDMLAEENGWPKVSELPEDQRPEPTVAGLNSYLANIAQNTADAILNRHDEVRNLHDFLENGGQFDDYAKTYFKQEADYAGIDLESEANQIMLADKLYQMKFLNKDADWRNKQIKMLQDSGALKEYAEDAKLELSSMDDAQKKTLVEKQKQLAAQEAQAQATYWNDLKQKIQTADNFAGIPITNTNRQKFQDYLTKADPKSGMTQYQKEIAEDKEAGLKMAYIQFLKYNLDSIKKDVKSTVSKDLKSALNALTDTTKKTGARNVEAAEVSDDVKNFGKFKPVFNI